jgi:hypothetical protein
LPLQFALGQKSDAFGQALEIDLQEAQGAGSRFVVRVEYETSPTASGLQWLAPRYISLHLLFLISLFVLCLLVRS